MLHINLLISGHWGGELKIWFLFSSNLVFLSPPPFFFGGGGEGKAACNLKHLMSTKITFQSKFSGQLQLHFYWADIFCFHLSRLPQALLRFSSQTNTHMLTPPPHHNATAGSAIICAAHRVAVTTATCPLWWQPGSGKAHPIGLPLPPPPHLPPLPIPNWSVLV